MNALLPIICCGTPGVGCGVPVIMLATSLLDLPQNEQQNTFAFIFAIIGCSQIVGRLLAVCDDLVY
jgi:hypothetical protein